MITMHPLEYRVRERRKTISDVARRVGANRTAIHHWMAGRQRLAPRTVSAMARYLRTSRRYLEGETLTLEPRKH